MKKVAVFGNAGGGKSTVSKQLTEITGLPLYALDKIQFLPGGGEVPHDSYLVSHADILATDEWIIEGFGCMDSAWARFAEADTLVYIDLPLNAHFVWVTKRFFKGLFASPEGWPANSPIFSSTLNSYRVLWLYRQKLTPKYREYVSEVKHSKDVYHLRSKHDISSFLNSIRHLNT